MATMSNNGGKNGANRCPHCGATDVKLDVKSGNLKCNFCRSTFTQEAANARGGVENLTGDIVSDGATTIVPDEKIIVTLKCPACGAEVVINTDSATSARCHWCRNVLSLNEKMPNGAVPDLVLPFKTEKVAAENSIRDFVKKRQFFAHPKFKAEFKPENVMGVYLPYMIVDLNSHANMKGEAEHLIRSYTSGGKSKTRYYDAEAFAVTREFDLLVDDLTIESSSRRLHQDVHANTNNVINAIMPFDTENCVDWSPNYLQGFASERRDTNVDDLRKQVKLQLEDIARYKVKESMTYYNRGAKWTTEDVTVKGSKWKAAYLPVWLYSYLQDDGKVKMLHYVAVNARTGETMGSVPINKTRLMIVSAILEVLGIVLGSWWIKAWLFDIDMDADDDNPFWVGLAGLTPGFIFYWIKTARYRNMNARHKHEAETPSEIKNLKKTDVSIGCRKRLRNSRIAGENDSVVNGVVAKNAGTMMGEKMANVIGIGRMTGSTAAQTATGQAAEAAAQKTKSAGKVIAIFIVLFIFFSIVVAALSNIADKTDEYDSSSSSSKVSTSGSLSSDIKEWSDDNTGLYSTRVSEMVLYNRNKSSDYGVYTFTSSDYNSAISVSKTEFSDDDLSSSRFVTDAGKALSKILEGDNLSRKLLSSYTDSGKDFTLGLYVNKGSSKTDFCELRETQNSHTSTFGYSYSVSLKCINVDNDVVEENDIRL